MANEKYVGPNRAIYGRATGTYEKNNHLEGRTGSGTNIRQGPASRGKGTPLPTNPTNGGGINRSTQSKS
jgi:hypothetical protein